MQKISLDISLMFGKLSGWDLQEQDLTPFIPLVEDAHRSLMSDEGDIRDNGIPMTGWLKLPFKLEESRLRSIMDHAREFGDSIDAFVSIGIGGSYLGIEATISALKSRHYNQLERSQRGNWPEIYFVGNNMDPDYISDTLNILKGKRVGIHVISKSGTTLETALAFRLLRKFLIENGVTDLSATVVVSTDRVKGGLRRMANEMGLKTYEIPEDIGGRFSVLTDPLLFSIAMAGIDLVEFWQGFRTMAELTSTHRFWDNMAMVHALLRYLAHERGKAIEVIATNSYYLHPLARWMEQLFPESEGHQGKGLWLSPSLYTEKLHANGQMVQQGRRNIVETFLVLQNYYSTLKIFAEEKDIDGLNFLAEQGDLELGMINNRAIEATAIAHYQGGVPNMTIYIPERRPFYLGQFYFLMEKSVALSGYLLGHNPFIQPGVEAYKKNMYALLGKPGTEEQIKEIQSIKSSLAKIVL